MTKKLEGKVAKILNSRELALNIGSNDGVEVGMIFEVVDPKGENIEDPDTGEVLGSIDRPKVRVKVTSVLERLSVASTYSFRKVNVGGSGGFSALDAFSKSLLPSKWVTKYETLKTDEKTWEDVEEEDCFVKTGDPVRQIIPVVPEAEESKE